MRPFHERLRELLEQRGSDATQSWLSDRSGVDRSLISRLLSGDRAPTAPTLASIAAALEVAVEELVAGTDAEDRLEDPSSTVRRTDYEAVVAKLIEYEAEIGDLRRRLNSTKEMLGESEKARRTAEQHTAEVNAEATRARKAQRDVEARLEANEAELAHHRRVLAQSVAEFAALRAQEAALRAQEVALRKELGDAKASSKVAGLLAGAGAVAGVAAFSKFLADDEGKARKSGSKRKRR